MDPYPVPLIVGRVQDSTVLIQSHSLDQTSVCIPERLGHASESVLAVHGHGLAAARGRSAEDVERDRTVHHQAQRASHAGRILDSPALLHGLHTLEVLETSRVDDSV